MTVSGGTLGVVKVYVGEGVKEGVAGRGGGEVDTTTGRVGCEGVGEG